MRLVTRWFGPVVKAKHKKTTMNINLVIIGGNITRDPELRYLQSGTSVCDFGVAVNKKWTTADGEAREDVSFFDVTFFGKRGEAISQYLKKGSPILVEGELKQETWDDRETGKPRSKVKVMGQKFHFVGGKKDDGERSEHRDQPAGRSTRGKAKSPIDDDDVPYNDSQSESDVPF